VLQDSNRTRGQEQEAELEDSERRAERGRSDLRSQEAARSALRHREAYMQILAVLEPDNGCPVCGQCHARGNPVSNPVSPASAFGLLAARATNGNNGRENILNGNNGRENIPNGKSNIIVSRSV
jgi:hypothetical protein